jgi:hypothetical protein
MMKLVILVGRFLFSRFPLIADAYRYWRASNPLKRALGFRPAFGFKFNGPESMEQGVFEPQVRLCSNMTLVMGVYSNLCVV